MRRIVPALFAAALACTAGTASAQGSLTLRDRLLVVSSSSSAGLTGLLARNFTERYQGAQAPVVQAMGSARAMDAFCAGVGPTTPDIVLSTRRMPRSVVETCTANGVRDIIEVQVGYGAVVVAAKRGDVAPALTTRQLWEAMAAERPQDDEFVPNRRRLWSDINPNLPRSEIRIIAPETGSGAHVLFEDLVLEAGCRHVREIRLIFEAAYRLTKCTEQRTDSAITSVPSGNVPAALLAAPPGTLAIMTYDQLVASGGNFVALAIDGVVPTPATIASDDYDQSRTFYVYAKRQHSRNNSGVGVVRGIHEFLAEVTSEQATGPGGYLTNAGLVPLPPAERAAQRRIALRQTLMSR